MDWREDGRYETGENQHKATRLIFAEHLSTYAKSGEAAPAAPRSAGPLRKNYKTARGAKLSADELVLAREVWQRLPRFDDLVRGRA